MKNKQENKERLPSAVVLYFLCLYFFLPLTLFAQIEITEIMYDPGEDTFGSKADGGREWIEIHNLGSDSVNLDGWKLFDNKDGGGHPLSSVIQGIFTIESGEYLIIADVDDEDDNSTFLTDYPNFSGTVLNSNFGSFNNTAGVFAVDEKDTNILNISWVEYSSDQGANGDGNSLQKVGGVWVASTPTPGEANPVDSQPIVGGDPEEASNESQDETPPSTTTATLSSAPATTYKIEPQVFAYILPTLNKPIAGASFVFEGDSRGLLNEPLQNAIYQWTFGDGGREEGQKVFYTYQYPGDYVVILQVVSGKYTGTDRAEVKVLPSDLVISDVGFNIGNQFIEIHNPSTYELNLSWWILRNGKDHFTLPKNTIILPKKSLKFSSMTTGFVLNENNEVSLLYPNGSVAFRYEKEVVPIVEKKVIVPISNQVASIQKAIEPVRVVEEPVEVEPPQVLIGDENLLEVATSSQPENPPSQEEKKGLLNKWNISLAGVVSLAVAGLLFTSKLDG